MKGLLPFLGGVMLLGAFVIAAYQYADPEYGNTTFFGIGGVFILGIGSLLIGVVLMIIWNSVAPAFFRGRDAGQTLVLGPHPGGSRRGRHPAPA